MSTTVNFYMQRYPIDGVTQVVKNLTTDFTGLLVSEVNGINTKGKNRNIYKEPYAEANGDRVWVGTPYYESTSINIKFYFKGTGRQSIYDSFCDYVNGYKLYYWDSYHSKKVSVIAEEIGEPVEEKYGSNPNIEVTIKFTNFGGTFTSV